MAYLFDTLKVWYDEQPRSGAENMAVDQLLLEQLGDDPVLRVYHWSEPTVSFGYSLYLEEARAAFPDEELAYVRRWTGGGVVDHRIDLTYTLVLPRENRVAMLRGAGSYEAIHKVLAEALCSMQQDVRLVSNDLGDGAAACFLNPVAYDILDSKNQKAAGAGQRRTRFGLLHQGSLIADVEAKAFANVLADYLSGSCESWTANDDLLKKSIRVAGDRYARDAWLKMR